MPSTSDERNELEVPLEPVKMLNGSLAMLPPQGESIRKNIVSREFRYINVCSFSKSMISYKYVKYINLSAKEIAAALQKGYKEPATELEDSEARLHRCIFIHSLVYNNFVRLRQQLNFIPFVGLFIL